MSSTRFVSLGLLPLVASLTVLACGDSEQPDSAPDDTPFEVCLRTVPALTADPLTDADFEEADAFLSAAIQQAKAGDVDGAQAAFVQPHTLTHNVDGPLRLVDEATAIRLCDEVVVMEEELVTGRDPSVVEEQARRIQEALAAAATALGMGGQ